MNPKTKLIGGPCAGLEYEFPSDGRRSIAVPEPLRPPEFVSGVDPQHSEPFNVHYYTVRCITDRKETIEYMAHESLTDADAIRELINGYKGKDK